MNKEQRARLLKLADFLDELPRAKFHLAAFMGSYDHMRLNMMDEERPDDATNKRAKLYRDKTRRLGKNSENALRIFHDRALGNSYFEVEPVDCRTAGCALGWAATIPEFREAGLRLATTTWGWVNSDGYASSATVILVAANTDEYLTCGVYVGMDLFGLTHEECELLFLPSRYTPKDAGNPKAVARRIRGLAAQAIVS